MSRFEPIAIVGIGCRFPGADGPESFWRLLTDGVDAISEVPPERWSLDEFYDSDPTVPGKMSTRWGGFLSGIDRFDAAFFGISPREAAHVDPQQRLLLEVAWEAMEDAGVPPETVAGQKVGVFVGMASCDYGHEQLADVSGMSDGYAITGSALSIGANRLSYVFDFRGPSLTVDTACSSSLVAVYEACQSIHRGESLMALAGGVNLVLTPAVTIGFSKLQAMAPDGRCRAFDAKAGGFVRGEGAGMVLVKPLAKAVADGDRIYAVIRGGAINQDGKTNGLTAPNGVSQEALLRDAMANAGVHSSEYHYVEAHGTGTMLGDPIELNALGGVLAAGRPRDARCAVGSVKTNIGHLEAAAGAAGLIKLALSISRRQVPPSLHFEQPNPYIRFDLLPLRVVTSPEPWPTSGATAVGGVSSFGFGGTNAHLVLEGAPPRPALTRDASEDEPAVLPLSARSQEALISLAQAYVAEQENARATRFVDLCATAAVRRSHHPFRLAVEASGPSEMVSRLQAFLRDDASRAVVSGRRLLGRRRRVAFVFPGQGSQWLGMGRTLIAREPVFADTIAQCSAAFSEHVDWSLHDELHATPDTSRLTEVDVVQPAIFAVQIALAALWRSWGVTPDAVVGHSMGEVAAAHVAGALSLADAARIICRRSQLVRRTSGQGAMAVVELPLPEANAVLRGYEDRLSVAVSNSPTSTVLSGEPAALDEVLATLEHDGVFVRRINVDYASHSPHMEPLRDELLAVLRGIVPRRAGIRLCSTVTGLVAMGPELDAPYWVRNLREPVLFAGAVAQLLRDGIDVFLEVSPHPILVPAVQQCADYEAKEATVLGSLRRDEHERRSLLSALASLYVIGSPVAWDRVYAQPYEPVPLPTYRWQRERFWFASGSESAGGRATRVKRRHPLIGTRIHSTVGVPHDVWEHGIAPQALAFLKDHRQRNLIVAPVAAVIEMVLEAATEVLGSDRPFAIRNASLAGPLELSDEGEIRVQVTLVRQAAGHFGWQVSRVTSAADADGQPSVYAHAKGEILVRRPEAEAEPSIGRVELPSDIVMRCPTVLDLADHAREMGRLGFEYGPSLQMLERVWRGNHEALGKLKTVPSDLDRYRVHPVLIDAAWQLLVAGLLRGAPTGVGRVSIERFVLHRAVVRDDELWAHAYWSGNQVDGRGSVRLLTQGGALVAECLGVWLEPRGAAHADRPELLSLAWEPQSLSSGRRVSRREGALLVLADATGFGAHLTTVACARSLETLVVARSDRYREPDRHDDLTWEINPAVREHYAMLFQDVERRGFELGAVLHLWSLDGSNEREDAAAGWESLLLLLQHIVNDIDQSPPMLGIVTRGAQHVGPGDQVSVFQAPIWGLARTAFQEHSELSFLAVDLDAAPSETAADQLLDELAELSDERQIAFRAGERFVARLALVDRTTLPRETAPASKEAVIPFRAELETSGPSGAVFRPMPRRWPSTGEIELEVVAAGLSARHTPRNVGSPNGTRPVTVGVMCAGRVLRLGEGVTGWTVGDDVVALAPSNVASITKTHASLVVAKPAHLDFDVAATAPLAFLDAFYAVRHLARVQAQERVLVHGPTDGVDLACVRLARASGAEVYATIARDEPRALLEASGATLIIDERKGSWVDAVLEATAGAGVDVIVSSQARAALAGELAVLGVGGRFVRLPVRSPRGRDQPLVPRLETNRSMSVADVWELAEAQPELCGRLLREAMHAFHGVDPTALPQVFPVDRLSDALERFTTAQELGDIVIRMDRGAVELSRPTDPAVSVHDDATYVISGGLDRLGLLAARWLVDMGARCLVLLGRHDVSPHAREARAAMEQTGVRVLVEPVDVSDAAAVDAAFARWSTQLPPVRGIVHAAGCLDLGIVLQQTPDRFRRVMAPKVAGAWNLHRASQTLPLDFFVLFSSASSVMGAAGESSDAAANQFLDALSHHRRAHRLPSLSISWGPWADNDRSGQEGPDITYEIAGMGRLSPVQMTELLGQMLLTEVAHTGAMVVDWREWAASYPLVARQPFFSRVAGPLRPSTPERPADSVLVASGSAGSPDERVAALAERLRQDVATVLRMPASSVDVHQPLISMGIDSLMAVELKGRLEREFGVTVPLLQLIKGPSVADLARLLSTSHAGLLR